MRFVALAKNGGKIIQLPRPPPPPSWSGVAQRSPLDIDNMKPIEPPWQAIKEWIPDDEPDLDWFNRPRNPSNPDPEGFDQRPAWKPEEIQLDDERILISTTPDWPEAHPPENRSQKKS